MVGGGRELWCGIGNREMTAREQSGGGATEQSLMRQGRTGSNSKCSLSDDLADLEGEPLGTWPDTEHLDLTQDIQQQISRSSLLTFCNFNDGQRWTPPSKWSMPMR